MDFRFDPPCPPYQGGCLTTFNTYLLNDFINYLKRVLSPLLLPRFKGDFFICFANKE
jgi:hypothetical protein